eukprot:TRINITY_DN19501_c0_g1_i3.p1 TRINITY_DN19501_c0_g1~~TRINITY_DN19501_c0_g1_i3.p1  ORF type:complete len:625 (-),score=126.97 TRINITY_DN19501_c0_g1_i3:129-2003(-)
MGVTHSMDDTQVRRVSDALGESARAIQGINTKFDEIDENWRKMQEFNQGINDKVQNSLDSLHRFDEMFNSRIDFVLDSVVSTTEDLTAVLQTTVVALKNFDIRRETNQIPKAIIPLAVPLIVLLIELAVGQAYLGILLASIPEVREKYSRYLFANATVVLGGLTLSLLWLIAYRLYLSWNTRRLEDVLEKSQREAEGEADIRLQSSFGQLHVDLREFSNREDLLQEISQRDGDLGKKTSTSNRVSYNSEFGRQRSSCASADAVPRPPRRRSVRWSGAGVDDAIEHSDSGGNNHDLEKMASAVLDMMDEMKQKEALMEEVKADLEEMRDQLRCREDSQAVLERPVEDLIALQYQIDKEVERREQRDRGTSFDGSEGRAGGASRGSGTPTGRRSPPSTVARSRAPSLQSTEGVGGQERTQGAKEQEMRSPDNSASFPVLPPNGPAREANGLGSGAGQANSPAPAAEATEMHEHEAPAGPSVRSGPSALPPSAPVSLAPPSTSSAHPSTTAAEASSSRPAPDSRSPPAADASASASASAAAAAGAGGDQKKKAGFNASWSVAEPLHMNVIWHGQSGRRSRSSPPERRGCEATGQANMPDSARNDPPDAVSGLAQTEMNGPDSVHKSL